MKYVKKGYKRKITDEIIPVIELRLGNNDTATDICADLNISRTALYNAAKRFPQIEKALYNRKLAKPHLRKNELHLEHEQGNISEAQTILP